MTEVFTVEYEGDVEFDPLEYEGEVTVHVSDKLLNSLMGSIATQMFGSSRATSDD